MFVQFLMWLHLTEYPPGSILYASWMMSDLNVPMDPCEDTPVSQRWLCGFDWRRWDGGLKKAPSVNLDKKAGFCVNASKFAGNNILYYLVSKDGELEIPVTTEGGKANSRMTW